MSAALTPLLAVPILVLLSMLPWTGRIASNLDFGMLATVVILGRLPPIAALFAAAFVGLWADTLLASRMGAHALANLLVVMLLLRAGESVDLRAPAVRLAVVFVATLAGRWFLAWMDGLWGGAGTVLGVQDLLFRPALTAIVSLIFWQGLYAPRRERLAW